jgi:ribosome maturation factor RimP
MDNWRKCTVMGLIVCLLNLTLADLTMARGAKSSDDAAAIKQKVEMFGVGAVVDIYPEGGERFRGTIQSIGKEDFVVAPRGSAPARHIAFDRVQRLSLTNLSYKAVGQPDPAAARRAVAGWGVGSKIRVTRADGSKLKGRIQTLDMQQFALLPDSQSEPVQIPFTDVQQVGSGGMSSGMQWGILGAVVGGVVIVFAALASAMSG